MFLDRYTLLLESETTSPAEARVGEVWEEKKTLKKVSASDGDRSNRTNAFISTSIGLSTCFFPRFSRPPSSNHIPFRSLTRHLSHSLLYVSFPQTPSMSTQSRWSSLLKTLYAELLSYLCLSWISLSGIGGILTNWTGPFKNQDWDFPSPSLS